ncbi:MAG TPA: hypothetical protein VGN54_13830, partial [Mycobacteriales bacterium]|nr:hypothetical protein [Mycobacteriales bacterium]
VQMTRKRVGTGLLEAYSETCEACNGRGVLIHLDGAPARSGTDFGSPRSVAGTRGPVPRPPAARPPAAEQVPAEPLDVPGARPVIEPDVAQVSASTDPVPADIQPAAAEPPSAAPAARPVRRRRRATGGGAATPAPDQPAAASD